MEEGRKEGRAPFDVRVGGRWGWQSRRGEWSGRLTGWAERGEERAELAAWGWWWWWWRRWLKAEETGGCVRVGFLAWHRGIDTPVGAQRHQRLLRRPTSLHLERTSSPSPLLPSVKLLHLESMRATDDHPSSTALRVFIARIFPDLGIPPDREGNSDRYNLHR